MSFSIHARDILNLGLRDDDSAQYAYTPTKYVCILFVALFGVSTVLHIGQAIYYRMWWLFLTVVVAGCLEVLGWVGRLWSSYDLFLSTPFMISTCTTIIGPTPLLAANFIIVERIIERLGTSYSRLSPKWYLIIFCSCDAVSLVVQGTGGGLAASANTLDDANMGANVMLGGIIFQLTTLILFFCLATEFFIRYLKDSPLKKYHNVNDANSSETVPRKPLTPKLKLMLIALAFNSACLFTRAIYRTVELSDGWTGPIISTELYFNILEGAMITMAICTMNFAHPGFLLRVPKVDAHSDYPKKGTKEWN